MLIVGDIVLAKIQGEIVSLTLDERVLSDLTCHQYESGWWASDEDGVDYFVSDAHTVYGQSDPEHEAYCKALGQLVSDPVYYED